MGQREPARSEATLTVDLGNSSAKLCLFLPGLGRGSEPEQFLPLTDLRLSWREPVGAGNGDGPDHSIAVWLRDHLKRTECGGVGRVLISSVAGPARTEALCRCLEELGLGPLERSLSPGLVNESLEPAGVGRDRLFAARGAVAWLASGVLDSGAEAHAGAIVVDAGTALTVDAVAWRPNRAGRFLGGAIAPGPDLLARALDCGAAQLPGIVPRPGAGALGRQTETALQAGVVVGFRGAAARLVVDLGRATELEGAPVLLTGGARAFLLEPDAFLGESAQGRLVVDPWLVERGLVAADRQARGR